MKSIEKIVLVVFSMIVLIIGICVNLLAIGWVSIDTLVSLVEKVMIDDTISKIALITNEVFMVFALICIFSDSSDKDSKHRREREVLMQNDNGKLMISKTTIENLVNVVIKDFPSIKESITKIQLDDANNVLVLVDLVVVKGVVIKELTLNIQNKIKSAIKNTSDLEVKEVNVRIKDIVESGENNI